MPFGIVGGVAPKRHSTEFHLPVGGNSAISLNDDGVTYSKILNLDVNLPTIQFTAASSTLLFTNGTAKTFIINATSDLDVNKAVDITYALVVNGTPVPSELTVTSFAAASKKRNISITAKTILTDADEIEIWVKADGTAGVTVTIHKLDMTFLEV